MTNLRELLVVAYHFPPIGGSGVQRVLKLARYLPEHGWRAHVVCCGHTHYPLIDDSLASEAGPHTEVHHTCGLEPGGLATTMNQKIAGLIGQSVSQRIEDGLSWRLERLLTRAHLPEHELLWVPAAVREARQLVRMNPIEAVLTSGPPHCTHWVGEAIQRRLGLPWIADFRDPILDNWARKPEGRWRNGYWRWLERTIVTKADRIVVTCQEVVDSLHARYPAVPAENFCYIPNGFDVHDAPLHVDRPTSKFFTLSHIGAFYRDQSVGPILEAIRMVRERNTKAAELLRFRLIGSLSAPQRALIRREDDSFLEHIGYLPHCDAIEEMTRSDVLMLMTPSNSAGRYCIPAKTFEYLAFGGHILAIVHSDTVMGKILREAGNTTVIDNRDVATVAATIEKCFNAWKNGTLQQTRDDDVVNRFRRDIQVHQFADLIDGCGDRPPMLRLVHEDAELQEAGA